MDDETRDWVRSVFGKNPPPPRDIVPGSGLSREDLLRQNANVGSVVDFHIPGEILEDSDGNPIGMTPSRTEKTIFGGASVTPAQLEAVGLTPDDVPNLDVVEPPRRKDQK